MSSTEPAATTPVAIPTIESLRQYLDVERAAGRTIGFVPTMGFLHDGHA